MTLIKEWAGVATVIGVLWLIFSPMLGQNVFGAVNIENYNPAIMAHGYNSEKPITLSGASGDITTGDDLTVTDDATISGGSLTVTTTNTATSTVSLGCIQTTATSTVTPVRFVIGSSGATTTHQGTNSVGVVAWQYGTCPI